MLLQNYDKVHPKVFNRMHFPQIEEPFPIRINWFHAVEEKVSGDFTVNRQMHRHRYYEAHFIVCGSTTYKSAEGEEMVLSEGRGALIAPQTDHMITSISKDMVKFSLTFSIDQNSDFHRALGEGMVSFQLPKELIASIDIILSNIARPSEFSEVILRNRLLEIIASISEACHAERSAAVSVIPSYRDHRVAMAKTFIRDNDHLFLSCKEVAVHCHLSVKHLERLFFAETEQKLLDYIHETKLASAKAQLADTDNTLQRISEDLGFSSVHYFHRFFTKCCGMTPSAYRRSVGVEEPEQE